MCDAGYDLTGDLSTPCRPVSTSPLSEIQAPDSIPHGVGEATGTVFLNSPPPEDVTVALSSSRPDLLIVPELVTVPAGQTSATFTLVRLDGTAEAVSVSVTATLGDRQLVRHITLLGPFDL
jgi:hypothetical protein